MNPDEVPDLDAIFVMAVRSSVEVGRLLGLDEKLFLKLVRTAWRAEAALKINTPVMKVEMK